MLHGLKLPQQVQVHADGCMRCFQPKLMCWTCTHNTHSHTIYAHTIYSQYPLTHPSAEHAAEVAAALHHQQQLQHAPNPDSDAFHVVDLAVDHPVDHTIDLAAPPRKASPEAQPIPPANAPPTVHRRNPAHHPVQQEIAPLGNHQDTLDQQHTQQHTGTIAAWSDAGSASKRKRPWQEGPAHVVVQVEDGGEGDKSCDKALVVLDGAEGLLPWGDGEQQAWFVPSVGLTKRLVVVRWWIKLWASWCALLLRAHTHTYTYRMASNPGVWHTTLQMPVVQTGPRWVKQGALMLDHYVLLAQQMVRKHPAARVGSVAYVLVLHMIALLAVLV